MANGRALMMASHIIINVNVASFASSCDNTRLLFSSFLHHSRFSLASHLLMNRNRKDKGDKKTYSKLIKLSFGCFCKSAQTMSRSPIEQNPEKGQRVDCWTRKLIIFFAYSPHSPSFLSSLELWLWLWLGFVVW